MVELEIKTFPRNENESNLSYYRRCLERFESILDNEDMVEFLDQLWNQLTLEERMSF